MTQGRKKNTVYRQHMHGIWQLNNFKTFILNYFVPIFLKNVQELIITKKTPVERENDRSTENINNITFTIKY